MGWRRLLLVGAIIALTATPLPAFARSGCSPTSQITGGCTPVSASTGNGEVTLGGSGSGSGSSARTGNAGRGGAKPPADCIRNGFNWKCMGPLPGRRNPASPVVTWADLASFRPAIGVAHVEPAQWTVHGLETNVYISGAPHVVSGSLFGLPADVRFIPLSYVFDYGDGATQTTAEPGASWAELGVEEFERTTTSHRYDSIGNYAIAVGITYAAEYQFADEPWATVAGTLTVPANTLGILVGDADTVLVRDGCEVNSASVGC